jgi:hypothetical protein
LVALTVAVVAQENSGGGTYRLDEYNSRNAPELNNTSSQPENSLPGRANAEAPSAKFSDSTSQTTLTPEGKKTKTLNSKKRRVSPAESDHSHAD